MAFPLQSFNQHNGYVTGWKGEDEDLTDIDLTVELEVGDFIDRSPEPR